MSDWKLRGSCVMSLAIGAVIFAAGEGKRLKLNAPKPLAPCLDKKLVDFPIKELKKFFSQNEIDGKITAVIGHQRELVRTYIEKNYSETCHLPFKTSNWGRQMLFGLISILLVLQKISITHLVICADTPVVSEAELSAMLTLLKTENLDGVAASFIETNPKGYGRIVRGKKGFSYCRRKRCQ